jgi:hypothetical protein
MLRIIVFAVALLIDPALRASDVLVASRPLFR